MGKVMIVNGSPRAVKSNSKGYADIFLKNCKLETEYFNITKTNHNELCAKMEEFSDVLFVFPLYVDGIPTTLLNFLKTLEVNTQKNKPVVSVLINCGFIEYNQNDVAIEMMKLFCKQNNFTFGSVLRIGSGEAILNTPFKILVTKKIKRLSSSIYKRKYESLQTTMLLSKKVFIKASTNYWINYGKKNGITKEQMETMEIE
ncbi:hypothetical protein [Anaerosporobacter sp.]